MLFCLIQLPKGYSVPAAPKPLSLSQTHQIYMSAVITESLCTGCGLCEKVCPSKAVRLQNKKAAVAENRCISCGHCGAVCSCGAVSSDLDSRKSFQIAEPAGSAVEQLLQGKRSVREFREEPIPHAVLEEMIRYGEMAPSSRNTRGRKYFVVTGNSVTELEGAVIRGLNRLAAPAKPFLPLLKIFNRKKAESLSSLQNLFSAMQNAYNEGRHPVLCSAPAVICIAGPKSNLQRKDDCVCAEQYLMLYAESIGIASCINGFTQIAHKEAEKYLNVPDTHTIEAVVMLGYPKYQYQKWVKYETDVSWKN